MHTICIFCGVNVTPVNVHGHYQCPVCKTNSMPCCDTDNCDNFFLAEAQHFMQNGIDLSGGEVINTGIKSSSG